MKDTPIPILEAVMADVASRTHELPSCGGGTLLCPLREEVPVIPAPCPDPSCPLPLPQTQVRDVKPHEDSVVVVVVVRVVAVI